jgi:hypothetical protein
MLLKTNEAGERLPRMFMKTNHLSRKARMLLKVQEITVEKAVTSDKQEALSHQLSAFSQGMG